MADKTLLEIAAQMAAEDAGHAARPPAPAAPKRTAREFPVTTTQLPVVRCDVCGRTLAHRPGQAAAVLTAHYQRDGHLG